ncbi:MAG TPA: phage baseplate assembly protein V [Candidatus Acidoferrum sp.]|nr:phage baseplate assembly protein V [Candidatus Acidoferrum sp.]
MSAGYVHVKVGGTPLVDTALDAVTVTQELNNHWWCRIECRHTGDQRLLGNTVAGAGTNYNVEDWLGKDLQIVSYDQFFTEHVLFDGFVLEVELEYQLHGSYRAQVTGVSKSYKMDLTPRHAYYLEKSLSSIAQLLADNTQLDCAVTCKDRRALNYVQWGESDFQFLRRLVDDHQCWMRPSEKGIEIFDSFQPGTRVTWRGESGENGLLSFSVKGKLAQPSFNGAHYNPHLMMSKIYKEVQTDPEFFGSVEPLVEAVKKASKETLPPGYLQDRSRAVTLDDYEQELKMESVRSIGGSVSGRGTSRNREIRPGNMLEISGVLDARGSYGVTRVVHTWTPKGYHNEFTCTPWKNYMDPVLPAPKPWTGVVPARVVEHNDPKKMGRIKVQYFWQEGGPAHWARMLTPHAGGDRGFMFMPEKGDEVAVAFEEGDPERPVILGALWNGVDTAPRQGFWGNEDIEANDVKRIVTKSGNRIQMVDKKGKESIVLATPGSIRVALINNAAETGRETLLLESSAGDIIFNAPNGRVHFCCKQFSREVGGSSEPSPAPPKTSKSG